MAGPHVHHPHLQLRQLLPLIHRYDLHLGRTLKPLHSHVVLAHERRGQRPRRVVEDPAARAHLLHVALGRDEAYNLPCEAALRAPCREFQRPSLQLVALFGQLVHLQLSGKVALRCAKPAECAARHIVGIDGEGIDLDVWNLVRTGAGERGVAEHLGGGVGIGAAVGDDLDLRQARQQVSPSVGRQRRL